MDKNVALNSEPNRRDLTNSMLMIKFQKPKEIEIVINNNENDKVKVQCITLK